MILRYIAFFSLSLFCFPFFLGAQIRLILWAGKRFAEKMSRDYLQYPIYCITTELPSVVSLVLFTRRENAEPLRRVEGKRVFCILMDGAAHVFQLHHRHDRRRMIRCKMAY